MPNSHLQLIQNLGSIFTVPDKRRTSLKLTIPRPRTCLLYMVKVYAMNMIPSACSPPVSICQHKEGSSVAHRPPVRPERLRGGYGADAEAGAR